MSAVTTKRRRTNQGKATEPPYPSAESSKDQDQDWASDSDGGYVYDSGEDSDEEDSGEEDSGEESDGDGSADEYDNNTESISEKHAYQLRRNSLITENLPDRIRNTEEAAGTSPCPVGVNGPEEYDGDYVDSGSVDSGKKPNLGFGWISIMSVQIAAHMRMWMRMGLPNSP